MPFAIRRDARNAGRRFCGDRRGAAAIEFALIAPLLLCMYFMTMEISEAVDTSKRVNRAGAMVADLVTQTNGTSKAEVLAIMNIGKAILQPYARSEPGFTVTAVTISNDAKPKATVSWSRQLLKSDGSYKKGPSEPKDDIVIPEQLLVKDSFLIRVESELDYEPIILWSDANKAKVGMGASRSVYKMKETFYLRPRTSPTVPCPDCTTD